MHHRRNVNRISRACHSSVVVDFLFFFSSLTFLPMPLPLSGFLKLLRHSALRAPTSFWIVRPHVFIIIFRIIIIKVEMRVCGMSGNEARAEEASILFARTLRNSSNAHMHAWKFKIHTGDRQRKTQQQKIRSEEKEFNSFVLKTSRFLH